MVQKNSYWNLFAFIGLKNTSQSARYGFLMRVFLLCATSVLNFRLFRKQKGKKYIFFSKISRKFPCENSVAKNSLLVFEEIPRESVKFVRSTSFSKIILNFAPATANHVQTDSIAKSDISFEYFNRALYFGSLLFPQCL